MPKIEHLVLIKITMLLTFLALLLDYFGLLLDQPMGDIIFGGLFEGVYPVTVAYRCLNLVNRGSTFFQPARRTPHGGL